MCCNVMVALLIDEKLFVVHLTAKDKVYLPPGVASSQAFQCVRKIT